MTFESFEFKLRRKGDLRKWDDIPVFSQLKLTSRSALAIASEMKRTEKVEEVRWNVKGSSQGHYTGAIAREIEVLTEPQLKKLWLVLGRRREFLSAWHRDALREGASTRYLEEKTRAIEELMRVVGLALSGMERRDDR